MRDDLLGHESKDADFVVPGVDYEGGDFQVLIGTNPITVPVAVRMRW